MNQYDTIKIDGNMRGSASVTIAVLYKCVHTHTHTCIQSAGADEKQTMSRWNDLGQNPNMTELVY